VEGVTGKEIKEWRRTGFYRGGEVEGVHVFKN